MASMEWRWISPSAVTQILHPRQTLTNGTRLRIARITDDLEIHGAEHELFQEPLPLRSGFQHFGGVQEFREAQVPLLLQAPNREALLDDLRLLNALFPTGQLGTLQIDRKLANQTTDAKVEIKGANTQKFGYAWSPDDNEGLIGTAATAQFVMRLNCPWPFFRGQSNETETFSIVAGAPVTKVLVNTGDEPVGFKVQVPSGGSGSQLIVVNNTTGRGITLTRDLSSPAEVDFYNDNPLAFHATGSGGVNLMPYLDIAAWLELLPGNNSVEIGGVGTFTVNAYWRSAFSSL